VSPGQVALPSGRARPTVLVALVAAFCGGPVAAPPPALPRLGVSADGRSLVREDGVPFFYLADTAWAIFHKTRRDEAERYLDDRRRKGFDVIQASITAAGFWPGLGPNAMGDIPFRDRDPRRPNEAFFAYVDTVIAAAAARGLYVALLPTWGEYVCPAWQNGPKIFDLGTARAYGAWLGRRYRGATNLIWVLGGDRRPDECGPGDVEVWRSLAEGLLEGLGPEASRALLTYHPRGGTHSSTLLHREPWLSFDLFQSSHCRNSPNYEMVALDRALAPPKPTLDGEPVYEHIPSCLLRGAPRIDAHDVRKAAWWSVLAGAAGHAYGASEVFSFWRPGEDDHGGWFATPWSEALGYPGATAMGHLRRLLESRSWPTLVPDPDLVAAPRPNPAGDDHVSAARAADGAWALVYVPTGHPIAVDLTRLSAERIRARWYDPRDGTSRESTESAADGAPTFTPPSSGPDADWVLVLDRVGAARPP